jgi:hypothetical protein
MQAVPMALRIKYLGDYSIVIKIGPFCQFRYLAVWLQSNYPASTYTNKMFEYVWQVLLIIILAAIIIVILFVNWLSRRLFSVSRKLVLMENENRQIRSESHLAKVVATRNTVLAQSQGEKIECLEAQMSQVHHWLGDVLQISNLIRCETGENTVETADVVELLREKIEWQKEVDLQSQDNSNYYKGD